MISRSPPSAQAEPDATVLLAWYDRHARTLPWRRKPGEGQNPYQTWLSEIMLQQTTVQAVKPYYDAFLRRWPRVEDLAGAASEEVMQMWAGLGYYSRARNLHACAKAIVAEHGGHFPSDESTLRTLPGIGVYTGAAITAIAFGRRAVVVDGNVERVVTRLYRIEEALPLARPRIRAMTDHLTPLHRPGDFAQAMMDLGATLCTPRKPDCPRCPFSTRCRAEAAGDAESFPRKAARRERPVRYGVSFVVTRADGALLVRTRPPRGLLGGMVEVPGTEWVVGKVFSALSQAEHRDEWAAHAPLEAHWRVQPGVVRHVFTHFPLELIVVCAQVSMTTEAPEGLRWLSANAIPGEAFPTVFRKVLQHAGLS